jgi:hypothetical protein
MATRIRLREPFRERVGEAEAAAGSGGGAGRLPPRPLGVLRAMLQFARAAALPGAENDDTWRIAFATRSS